MLRGFGPVFVGKVDRIHSASRGGSIAVPYGKVQHVLLRMEWTRLELAVIDQKVYAPGIGIVSEVAVAGAPEYAKLVAVHRA